MEIHHLFSGLGILTKKHRQTNIAMEKITISRSVHDIFLRFFFSMAMLKVNQKGFPRTHVLVKFR